MSQPILQVEHLKKYFPAGGRKVLRAVDDVSFSVQEGEILGIVGESGCGKTTCGRTAIGLYSKTDGVSLYRGEDVHRMRGAKRRAFCCQVQTVFQTPTPQWTPKTRSSTSLPKAWTSSTCTPARQSAGRRCRP